MAGIPALDLLDQEAAAELAAQRTRGDALDTKAGVVLGFAGVLVPLSASSLHGRFAVAGTVFAALAALLAGAAFLPRSFATLNPMAMRQYLASQEEFVRLRLYDTRIAIYLKTRESLERKAWLLIAATLSLGFAVILTVVASILIAK